MLCADPRADELTGLVIGEHHLDQPTSKVVELLVAAAEQLPSLTALFLSDTIQPENEISWIEQADVSPLLDAIPRLRRLHIRGGIGLSLGKLEHHCLQTLVIESGGLPVRVLLAGRQQTGERKSCQTGRADPQQLPAMKSSLKLG